MRFERVNYALKMLNHVQNYALIVIKNSHFPFIIHTFSQIFSVKKFRTKKKSSFGFVHILTDFSIYNTHIGTLKHIITNLTIVSTHYAPKLCTKNANYVPKLCAKIQNYAHKLCIMRQKPNYALKSQLHVFLCVCIILGN